MFAKGDYILKNTHTCSIVYYIYGQNAKIFNTEQCSILISVILNGFLSS